MSRDTVFGAITNPLSLNRFGYALDNPLLLADPSGLSSNRAMQNTPDDNQCFSNAGGVLNGNVINVACLNTPTGAQIIVGFVGEPPPPHWQETVVFAKPGTGGGDAATDEEKGEASVYEGFVKDYQTKRTVLQGYWFNGERHARALAREVLGSDPVEAGPNKLRSVNGKWQYRAKPGDLKLNHVHVEELNPDTGEVLQNYHLYWKK